MKTKHTLTLWRIYTISGAIIAATLLLLLALAGPALAYRPSGVLDKPADSVTANNFPATQAITTSPDILNSYNPDDRLVDTPLSIPLAKNSVSATQLLNCNPSGGSGGLAAGTHDTTIAGRPATVIVGAGYNPAQPTYLAFYLHGDGGGYNFFISTFSSFINANNWIYVAPQAPKATDGNYYPWDGSGGGSISDNATLVRNVLDDMFAKYNVCRNILFGGSASGGSWFWDYYFFPLYGGQYPAFINLVCGAGGVLPNDPDLVALSGNPDIIARSEHKYTIGDGDFLYPHAVTSSSSYETLGFNVIKDFLPGYEHCLKPKTGFEESPAPRIRNYWQSKLDTLTTAPTLDKALAFTTVISPSSEVTYTISITNGNVQAINNLTVGDSLPAKMTYVAGSAVANPAIVNLTNFPDTSNPFTLPGNSSVIITYRLRVTDTAANGEELMNTAMISAPTFSQAIIDIVVVTVGSSGETKQIVYLPFVIKN